MGNLVLKLIVCLVFLCYFIQAIPSMPRNDYENDIIVIKKHKTVKTMRRHREKLAQSQRFDMDNDFRSFRQSIIEPSFFNLDTIKSYLGFPRRRITREVIGLPENLISDDELENSKGTKRELREPVASELINEDGLSESIMNDRDLNKRVIKDEARASSVILDENEKDGEEKPEKIKKSGEKVLKKIKVEKMNQPSGRSEEIKPVIKKDSSKIIIEKIPKVDNDEEESTSEKLKNTKSSKKSIEDKKKLIDEEVSKSEKLVKDSEEPMPEKVVIDEKATSKSDSKAKQHIKPLVLEKKDERPVENKQELEPKRIVKEIEKPKETLEIKKGSKSEHQIKDPEESEAKPLINDVEESGTKPSIKKTIKSEHLIKDAEESERPSVKDTKESDADSLVENESNGKNKNLKEQSKTIKLKKSDKRVKRSSIESQENEKKIPKNKSKTDSINEDDEVSKHEQSIKDSEKLVKGKESTKRNLKTKLQPKKLDEEVQKSKSVKDEEESEAKPLVKDEEELEPKLQSIINPTTQKPNHVAERDKTDQKKRDNKNFKEKLNKVSEKSKRSSESSQLDENPCESGLKFNYFVAFVSDPTKYVECDPWGTYEIKQCDTGLVWDSWSYRCSLKENLKQISLIFPSTINSFNVSLADKCVTKDLECLNGATCLQYNNEQKCICTSSFTGEFCETDINTFDLYHQILFGNFSIDEYKAKIVEENVTTDIAYHEKYKNKLDLITYEALINYLSFYQKNDIRYDTLVTALLEDILDNMYPDSRFLAKFNASSKNVGDIVKIIPNIISYAKYTFGKQEKVFLEYEKVLEKLAQSLNTTGNPAKFRLEATKYQQLTYLFLNKTIQSHDSQAISIRFTDSEMKNTIKIHTNSTLQNALKLLEIFGDFQTSVQKKIKLNPNILNATLAESKITESIEIIRLLNGISTATNQMWDSYINYGFWFLTNLFSS